ncbi:MAG: CDP-alcohol phosphatidyltransferase family protein [Rectinema sp.]
MKTNITRDSLARSIVLTTSAYFAAQLAIFAAFAVPVGFLREFGPGFLATCIAFHLLLAVVLVLFRADFVKESTGEKLGRINMANRITMARVSTLPTILFLVIAAKDYKIRIPLLVLVVLVFATDFADGYVSRKAQEVTRVGRMLDSASDYSLLIVLSVVFQYYDLIPVWLFILVLVRLGLQAALMGSLALVRRRLEPRSTFLGKVAIAAIMVLYSLEILDLVSGGLPQWLTMGAEWVVAVILVLSIGDKIINFVACLRESGDQNGSVSDGDNKKRA